MTQVYCQENAQALDCEYLFPLPADGAVYRCEATINGRVIRAKIEEREAARKLVAKKKAEGRRTALVESERENLFTLSLGNIQPQDVVEVSLAYLQPLRRLADQVSLDLPLCPGIRYIPGNTLLRSNRGLGIGDDTDQVPDASRVTPPRIDGNHPDAAFIELDGQVEEEFMDGKVTSPTHNLTAKRTGGLFHLTLARGGVVPDRDLALRWKEREPSKTALRGWISQDHGNSYALLELRAPAKVVPSDNVAQDFYFLVDRSGSMEGEKWRKAIQALHGCVGVLGPKDRVAVTLFESAFKDFDAEPVSPSSLMADPRFLQLASLGTAGGTEMEPALRHVLELVKRFSKDRTAVLILITDAQIANEQELVALMRGHPSLPMHCFGIDTVLNDSLLLDLVRQQGGTYHALQPNEDVAADVTRLARTLRQPVLVNLQAPIGWELAAGAIPSLYAGQIHLVSMRSKGAPETNTLAVQAINHRNNSVGLKFDLTPVKDSGPRLRWCKERLVALMAQDEKDLAITLSKEANLLCPLTAFVAWDESERVAVANHRLVQPSLSPMSLHEVQVAYSVASCMPKQEAASVDLSAEHKLDYLSWSIEEIMLTLGSGSEIGDYLNLLLELHSWAQQFANSDIIALVEQLLDVCKKWANCEQRLHEYISKRADDLEHATSSLLTVWSQPHRRTRLARLKDAVSQGSSDETRQMINNMLVELTQLEDKFRRQIEELSVRTGSKIGP